MIHKFQKFSDDPKNIVAFKEKCVIAITDSLIRNGLKLEDFGPTISRQIWQIADFLAEERKYRLGT